MWMQKVKERIVKEYQDYVKDLQVGKSHEYSHILDMICFLEIAEYLNNADLLAKHFTNERLSIQTRTI